MIPARNIGWEIQGTEIPGTFPVYTTDDYMLQKHRHIETRCYCHALLINILLALVNN